jgi:Flp pilus assembly protein TadD
MKRARALLALAALALALPVPGLATSGAARADDTRDLYLLLIRQARADGRPRAALAYLADFVRRHPHELAAQILRINCLLDLGQVDQAEAALADLPQGAATETVRGHVLAARGDWAAAASAYRAALAATPADALIGNALGYAQLRAGRADAAVETLRAAADLAPGNRVIRNNLLLALTLSGHGQAAQAAIRALPDAAALRRELDAEAARLAAAPRRSR